MRRSQWTSTCRLRGSEEAVRIMNPPTKTLAYIDTSFASDYTPTTLSSPVSSLPPATLRRTSTPQQSISTGRPSVKTQQATRSQPPSVPPNPPPQPCQLVCARLHHIPCTGTSFTTLESMLASFPYPLSHVNTDRLAVILAAKVAILNEGSRGRCRRSNTSTVAGRVEAVGAQGSSS
jgi:hypothetical protein